MKITALSARMILNFCLLLSSACTVGPDYVRPTTVEAVPTVYKELEGWKVAQPSDSAISEQWWEIYHDPVLNSLEEQITASNFTVALAESRLRQAHALVKAAKAGYFPSASTGASATRSERSGNLVSGKSGGTTGSDLQISLNAAWEVDLWGKVRRGVEASQANAQASAADFAAVTLSTRAELAGNYLQLRVVDSKKQLLDATTGVYRKSLELTKNRYVAGLTDKADILQAETQLKSTEAQAIDLGVQRAQLEHAIAILVGKPPSAFSLLATSVSTTVPQIPAGLPSELLERRPDISIAERQVAVANEQIGIAQAAWFPTVRLSGSLGFEASSLATLFALPSRFWSAGPAIAATLFDGGMRKAQSDLTRAAYDATVAAYRETVLTSFKEVEDNLAALRILEEESHVQAQAVQAAGQVVSITTNQYQAGIVSYLNVLTAQSVELANKKSAVDIHGRRLAASILLIKALGGGWSASEIVVPASVKTNTATQSRIQSHNKTGT